MLQEYKMLKHRPSLVAACAVYVARGSLGQAPWTTFLHRCSRISEDDLLTCLEDIKRFMDRPLPVRCVSTMTKFRNSRFGSVASTTLRVGDWSFSSSLITNQACFTKTPPVLFHDEAEEMWRGKRPDADRQFRLVAFVWSGARMVLLRRLPSI